MRTRLLASVLALAMLFPQSALSWDTRGHMMVAAVAYKKHNRAPYSGKIISSSCCAFSE